MTQDKNQPMHASQKFFIVGMVFQFFIILLFGLVTEYREPDSVGFFQQRYAFFQDVHVMIFVGFGFLMTFLQKYSFGAVGFTLMISAFVIEWAILVNGFFHHAHEDDWSHKIQLDITSLVGGDFAAGAVLITFGALLGRVNPLQLFVVGLLEVVFYGLNEMIGIRELAIADVGGSMIIHTFGAYFGLAVSLAMTNHGSKQFPEKPWNNTLNSSTKTSDTFAMIGTVFLWMFWPSFNGVLAADNSQPRVVLNTVLSLCGSCVCTFLVSPMLRKEPRFKLNMVDVQNATLAGGVAIGASADYKVGPFAAILVGSLAGTVSVWGYTTLQPLLESKLGLADTCGVHNLHGMPGIIGGLASVTAAGTATLSNYGQALYELFPKRAGDRSAGDQAGAQLAALLITLAISLLSGYFTGFVVGRPWFDSPSSLFNDEEYWHVEEEENNPEQMLLHPGRLRSPRVDNAIPVPQHTQTRELSPQSGDIAVAVFPSK